jgi:hypothetical protein
MINNFFIKHLKLFLFVLLFFLDSLGLLIEGDSGECFPTVEDLHHLLSRGTELGVGRQEVADEVLHFG